MDDIGQEDVVHGDYQHHQKLLERMYKIKLKTWFDIICKMPV